MRRRDRIRHLLPDLESRGQWRVLCVVLGAAVGAVFVVHHLTHRNGF